MNEGKLSESLQKPRLRQSICRGIAATAFVFSFLACLSPGSAGQPGNSQPGAETIDQGRAIAEKFCARCHAIDADDGTGGGTGSVSPHRKAPPFRVIATKYPLESLEEAFAEGIAVGHADMPEFQLEPNEITALLSYMDSISR